MALDIALLRSSFDLVLARQPDLTHVFYEDLFSRYPAARPLFGRTHSLEVQEQMLAEALVAVLNHLEDDAWLQASLGQLGTKHAGYGVTNEMYGWVGESLLAVLARAAGADWTPAHDAAWKDAYGAIATLMLAGYPVEERRA
jgi:hemoglobin-like flavoprotein